MHTVSRWTFIKAGAAHLFGDYGAQTAHMASYKNTDARVRTQHAGYVAASFAAAMATDGALSNQQRAVIVAINTSSHFLIDSFKLPKWFDQALHLGFAVGSVLFVSWRAHGPAVQR